LLEIEKSTPFLKPGKILDDLDDEGETVSIDDFEFVDKKKMLGKGAYGEVKLVRFK
jgi:hypothetical protein